MIATLLVLTLLAGFLRAVPARAAEATAAADRSQVVAAWLRGGVQVRTAAEAALIGSDDQVREFLTSGWQQAARLDERDALVGVIGAGGPAVRAAVKRALDAADAGDENAIAAFLQAGWQEASNLDARVSVNQLMATGGPQVRQVAQQTLDAETPALLREFLDSGWQTQWQTDQRLRVNQAMATGGPQVRAAGQKALDTGTPEALEQFLDYGWAAASARDDEIATLTDLLAQAEAAGAIAAEETEQAKQEATRAKEAADGARRAAVEAARATEAAKQNTEEAAAQARRAAAAAQKAADAAKVAVQAAAAANRAARAAATAAARAAAAASRAGQAAAKARKAAADAVTDRNKAAAARETAVSAMTIAGQTREFADKAEHAVEAVLAGLDAIAAAKASAEHARQAAAANDEAAEAAKAAGADASQAIAAAQRARANAERAVRAAQAAERYLLVARSAAFAARDAARRAADNAEAAARAAIEAAEHAGEATDAARRATENAEAATLAAQDAVKAATDAVAVFEAARQADAERLAVARDQGLEAAQAASTAYGAQQRVADWDVEQAAQRDAETNRLIALAQNPATPAADAVAAGRKAALALARAQGTWTRQAAMAALSGNEAQVLEFMRTGLAAEAARDDRQAVMDLAVTDNTALRDAALAALNGSDDAVRQFLRTQNYPGRYTQDRMKVNQILSTAQAAGNAYLAQKAQEALNAESLQALRDFLDTGQYSAAAVGERLQVNQILTDPDSGPEVKAAAQVTLDGPPTALREFLDVGRYTAAERDYESAAHLAVVGGLLEKINEVAETAMQNAMEAQAVAAKARNDAQAAVNYANRAAESARKAADYASRAQGYANQAAQSVEKAAAAVSTARKAATQATASARSAIRSAAWATTSQQLAARYASEAQVEAIRAREAAIDAGANAEAANAAAKHAYEEYTRARGTEIAKCLAEYASGPAPDLEKALDPGGEWARKCIANKIADPKEIVRRAYTNAAYCGLYPGGSQLYQNCLYSVLDPEFKGMQMMTVLAESVNVMTAMLIASAVPMGALCLATVACGSVAGGLLTIYDVGLNIYKLINGDQSLAQTLLNLGQSALESLLLAGVGKLLGAGFRAVKALAVVTYNAKKAEEHLQTLNTIRLMRVYLSGCVRHSFAATAPVLIADGNRRPISEISFGDQVLATEPATGQTTSRPVTRVWRHHDNALADVAVADSTGATSTLHTTATHPFWSNSSREWVEARSLAPSPALRTPTGAGAAVHSVRTFTKAKEMYDLTVADVHSYYVVAGGAMVLAHNTSCFDLKDLGANWYESPAGLLYGPQDRPGSLHKHAAFHVGAHMQEVPRKRMHTVFSLGPDGNVFELIDKAWLRRSLDDLTSDQDKINTPGARLRWAIPMDNEIGTKGERIICIVADNFNEIVTAFPVKKREDCRG
ncbi:polymorphic toxin-type HINT domain-containing protein [Streptosporangium sandarakinum]|uniref:polymorphic toxin-type HINT domain-containing protein n=1 Tax=Streptosporangium sandarakinum TaxID=1260955 RepID=UPI0036831D31